MCLSPERIAGSAASKSSDVYALGLLVLLSTKTTEARRELITAWSAVSHGAAPRVISSHAGRLAPSWVREREGRGTRVLSSCQKNKTSFEILVEGRFCLFRFFDERSPRLRTTRLRVRRRHSYCRCCTRTRRHVPARRNCCRTRTLRYRQCRCSWTTN